MSIIEEEHKFRSEDNSHDFYHEFNKKQSDGLREKVHELMKKDAIARQEIAMAERERDLYLNQILEAKKRLENNKKLLARDEALLRQETKSIANAQAIQFFRGIPVEENAAERLNKIKQWILEGKRRFDNELELYKRATSLVNALAVDENDVEAGRALIGTYDELISSKEYSIHEDEAHMNEDLAVLAMHKTQLEKLRDKLNDRRTKDNRTKLQLESYTDQSEGGYRFYLGARDREGENALQAAEALVHRYKSKIIRNEEVSPQRNDRKMRIFHIDLRSP